MGEKWPRILPKVATSMSLLCSFTCHKARHGTDGLTSPPKEGVLRIFSQPFNVSFIGSYFPFNDRPCVLFISVVTSCALSYVGVLFFISYLSLSVCGFRFRYLNCRITKVWNCFPLCMCGNYLLFIGSLKMLSVRWLVYGLTKRKCECWLPNFRKMLTKSWSCLFHEFSHSKYIFTFANQMHTYNWIFVLFFIVAPWILKFTVYYTPTNALFYRVSIKSFADYKHLLQENYVEYKHVFLPILKLISKILCRVFIVMLQLHNLLVSKWRQWKMFVTRERLCALPVYCISLKFTLKHLKTPTCLDP
jgi:hypothetical protein